MRKLLVFILLTLVVLFAASVVLMFVIDPNEYRQDIEELGSAALGRKIEISGSIELVPGLVPGLRMKDVSVANPEWAATPHLGTLENLEGRIDLRFALRGEFHLARLRASGGQINLEHRADGTDNFTFADLSTSDRGPGSFPDLHIEQVNISYRHGTAKGWTLAIDSVLFRGTDDGARRVDAKMQYENQPISVTGSRAGPVGSDWQISATAAPHLKLDATGMVAEIYSAAGVDLTLSGESFAAALVALDLPTPPFDGPFEFTTNIVLQDQGLHLSQLNGSVGDSDISGTVQVGTAGPRPRVDAKLTSRALFPVREPSAGPIAEASDSDSPGGLEIPVETLRGIDVDLVYKATRIASDYLSLKDMTLRMNLQDGLLKVPEIAVTDASGATLKGDLDVDARKKTPAVRVTVDADNFDLGGLLAHLGWTEGFEDQVDIDVALTAHGADQAALLKDLSGRVVVVSGAGSFSSRVIELWAADLVTTMLSPKWRREDVTRILCGVISANIEAGVATLEHLLVDTERMIVAGTGSVDFDNQSLDLLLVPQPKKASLVSLARPTRVDGPFSDVRVATVKIPTLKRMAKVGTLAVLNPAFLLASFTNTGQVDKQACVEAVQAVSVGEDTPNGPAASDES